MILFLVLLLLVGVLIFYWQKDPFIYENFVSSNSSEFSSIMPTTDSLGAQMNGTLYMYYVLTTNHLPGKFAGTDNVPAGGGDAGFNYLTNTQLRLATEQEKAYFVRNGGEIRENTTFAFPAEVGAGPSIFNKAKLVVSTKPPNARWDATGDPRVSFTMTSSLFAIETVLQGDWIRGIVRYPFDDSGTFTVFKIDQAEYTKSISDCLFIGKAAAQALGAKGISKIELLPNAPLLENIANDDFIVYTDTNIGTASASVATISSGSYNGATDGQTDPNISAKLTTLNTILDKPNSTNFKDATGAKMSLRKALQQKCGATIFANKLTFDANVDVNACGTAMNTLLSYKIAFGNYTKLLECTLCTDTNNDCKPGKSPMPSQKSLLMFDNPIQIQFTSTVPNNTGITFRIGNIKLGNGFTYELQLIDKSDSADNSSKYIFNQIRFVGGERDNGNADISQLEIIIDEYTNTIQLNSIATNQRTSLGTTNTPANFKLYSAIKLQAIIYTYANRSVLSNIENYSVSYIDQVISDETRYGLYKTDIYSRESSTSKIDFVYNDANSIKATFTYGTTSRIVPGGNYTLEFKNDQTGSFLNTTALGVGQFTHILLNVLTGKLSFMNNSTEAFTMQTKFKEEAESIDFTLALKDPTNTQTYYNGAYTALGNRYDGTVKIKSIPTSSSSAGAAVSPAPAPAEDGKEVVYIETPIKDGIDAETAKRVATQLGGTLATIDQVVNAMLAGANWCTPGWCMFTDINGKEVIRAAYPVTSQLLDSKCITQDDSISLYNKGVVVVSTDTTLKTQLMVYRTKETIPSNKTVNNLVYKQGYFNAMTGRWKQSAIQDTSGNEIFAITKKQGTIDNKEIATIATTLECTIATIQQIEKQLEYIKGKSTPLPNITVNGWALDNSNFPIKIKFDGKITKLENNAQINSLYCYGNKSKSNGKLDKNIYTMQAYNAQLNMANQDDNAPYKPLNVKTQTLIDKADKYNVKAALLVKEVRETNGGILKQFGPNIPTNGSSSSFRETFIVNDGRYVGCDVNAYACILDGSGEKQPIPLVSKTNKFKIMEIETSNGSAFEKPDTMEQAIQNVLKCQALGGDIAITNDTYPGCSAGYCCEPTDPPDNLELNASMFPETCDDSNSATAVEQCDETDGVLPLHQQAFEPYKLTRVQRTKTPTTAKCSKPTLSKALKGNITETFKNTPEFIRDVYEIAKHEEMFTLRMR